MGETHQLVSPARVFARPTADEIWLGAAQRAALSQLSRPAQSASSWGRPRAARQRCSITSARSLRQRRRADNAAARKRTPSAVLASLLLSADLAPWDLSEIEQRNLLTVFLQQRHSQKRRVLLLIDDAHNFEPAALEEIERLLAFKVDKKPALELLVAGPASVAEHWNSARRATRCGSLRARPRRPRRRKTWSAISIGGSAASRCSDS